MFRSIVDFTEFYKQPMGKITQTVIGAVIDKWIGDTNQLRVIGLGYALPYLETINKNAEFCAAFLSIKLGGEIWPDPVNNKTCIVEESELPLETNSVDRIILIHSLEYAELLPSNLQEIWRVLKGNGRLIIITPNRLGFWSRAVWSPFGHGTPSTLDQLRFHLREHQFTFERHKGALFVPPLRFRMIERAYKTFEFIGSYIYPALAGVHIIEATKQLYAGVDSGGGTKIAVRNRVALNPTPAPLRFSKGHDDV